MKGVATEKKREGRQRRRGRVEVERRRGETIVGNIKRGGRGGGEKPTPVL